MEASAGANLVLNVDDGDIAWLRDVAADHPVDEAMRLAYVRFRAVRGFTAQLNWVYQTYLRLSEIGYQATLSNAYAVEEVNVVAYDDMSRRLADRGHFVVCCQHDRARPYLCDARIVQNIRNATSTLDFFVPHWPQPGLQPRDPARGHRIENLVYRGRPGGLDEQYRTELFRRQLASRGVRLVFADSQDASAFWSDWTDYRTADLVLAARRLAGEVAMSKPASKLVNAWQAGCPALLGPEPAYRELRRSPLDYIEVRSAADVIEAIDRLAEEPELYDAMVQRGRLRLRQHGVDAVRDRWVQVLETVTEDSAIARGRGRWRRSAAGFLASRWRNGRAYRAYWAAAQRVTA